MSEHCLRLQSHYEQFWGARGVERRWGRGPVADLPDAFCVLEFPPTAATFSWVYATRGMSLSGIDDGIELHLLAREQNDLHVELLTVCAHYHLTGSRLGLHHTVNFGRPWLPGSKCGYGFISLPYSFGPKLENFTEGGSMVRCLWLIPVTAAEVEFKKEHGAEMLERRFEEMQFDYLDWERESVC